MGFGGGGMILWWLLIIASIAALAWWLTSLSRGNNSSESAKDILDQRYARGEIDREEYEQHKRDLEG